MLLDHILQENRNLELPEHVIRAFEEIGNIQRGRPEQFMVRLQHKMGGGVMNVAIEHSGDLIHRLTHMTGYGYYGITELNEKVAKLLSYLRHPYGFEKEFEENIINNAKYRNKESEAFYREIIKDLRVYSQLHEESYKVYNKIQYYCQRVPVFLGKLDIRSCIVYLELLNELIKNEQVLKQNATEYELDRNGNLVEYTLGGRRR